MRAFVLKISKISSPPVSTYLALLVVKVIMAHVFICLKGITGLLALALAAWLFGNE